MELHYQAKEERESEMELPEPARCGVSDLVALLEERLKQEGNKTV